MRVARHASLETPDSMKRHFLLLTAAATLCLADCPFAFPTEPVPRAGWKIELLAQAPEISHPSVVTTAPDGRVFVAEDPMDIRIDTPADSTNGRIVCLHPDGRRTVFAEKLYAVYGMQYLEGELYVTFCTTHRSPFSATIIVLGESRATGRRGAWQAARNCFPIRRRIFVRWASTGR